MRARRTGRPREHEDAAAVRPDLGERGRVAAIVGEPRRRQRDPLPRGLVPACDADVVGGRAGRRWWSEPELDVLSERLASAAHAIRGADYRAAVKKANDDYAEAVKDAKGKKGKEHTDALKAAKKAKVDALAAARKAKADCVKAAPKK